MPMSTVKLENIGLTEGNQYASAAFKAPNPIPTSPAKTAIGAMI